MVTGKWVAVALTASLAINVFLAGLFVGRQMGRPPHFFFTHAMPQHEPWHPGDGGLPPFIERMADTLAPQDRATLLSVMKKHQADIAARGVALRDARRKVRDVVEASQLDPAAAETALADLRQSTTAFQQTLQSALLDAAEHLPAEARRRMLSPRRGPPDGGPPERGPHEDGRAAR